MLRVNEHYTSIQGEGPHTGALTQFIRFSGCNMRCPGWPCDTPYAVYPHLWKNDPKMSSEDLFLEAVREFEQTGSHSVCLTGGEPYLQPKDELHTLIQLLIKSQFYVEMFSNGSFQYEEWLLQQDMTIVMDWKLEGSGEASTHVEERYVNARRLRHRDVIKFVVTGHHDLEHARAMTNHFQRNESIRAKLYVGAAWGKITDDEIVDFIKEYKMPWSLNVQVHKHIWGEKRGV